MAYYSYHSTIRKLIREGHLERYELVGDWNGIRPALVFYFDNHRSMPVREERWEEYWLLLRESDGLL